MNRKIIFRIVIAISMVALAACAAPTATPSSNIEAPATAVNTDANVTASGNSATNIPAPTASSGTATDMDPSLACSGGKTSASPTLELTEGPYYTPNTPERASLYEEGMSGTKLVIVGYVYDANCQTVANAWLDFWQANANGEYDNSGYTLRGHQFTDANGRYELTTVVPGVYPRRTEHIHLKIQSPNGQVITSQLFFPGVTQNESDGIFDESLLLSIQESSDGLLGQYNFVVP